MEDEDKAMGRKALARKAIDGIRAIEARHEEGQPVYAEMAARIEQRHRDASEDIIREAMDEE